MFLYREVCTELLLGQAQQRIKGEQLITVNKGKHGEWTGKRQGRKEVKKKMLKVAIFYYAS